jgi:type II secretory pathway pseudopilin PulG
MASRSSNGIPYQGQAPLPRHRVGGGFTLIELLIALVLLDVGLLALVGIAASITRDANSSHGTAKALSAASARLERAASLECRGAAAGVARVSPGLTEWFTELPQPNETRIISDSVAMVTSRGVTTIVLRTGARC